MKKSGRIAFISTPKYRDDHPADLETFVYKHLYSLCSNFEVLSTGRTFDKIEELLLRPFTRIPRALVAQGMGQAIHKEQDLEQWRSAIQSGLVRKSESVKGMIEIAHELVEGRLDAVIHLSDWGDVASKPDSMVLRREANVHKIPMASDVHTAQSMIHTWLMRLQEIPARPVFPAKKTPLHLPLQGLKVGNRDRVLAMIAHDAMKLEMCCLMVEQIQHIYEKFDVILATGTTGRWLRDFVLAAGHGRYDPERIRCCLSGPHGGDVQIAAAVVNRYCRKVIFLQDPFTSHAHETDIRLFEQAVLLFQRMAFKGVEIELATNVEAARMILGVDHRFDLARGRGAHG